MPKHIFFDLDNTLTPSRRRIKPEHAAVFAKLCGTRDVIVVTGGTQEHIEEQLGSAKGSYFILAQSGNHAVNKAGAKIWLEQLSAEQVRACLAFIQQLKAAFKVSVKDEGDLVDNRGAQIGYSVIGYHEDPAKKDSFDAGFVRRKEVLSRFTREIATLQSVGIEVLPGGSTGFNFTLLGKDKGFNVARYIDHEGWKKEHSLYVGDALGPGENDASVIGVIPTHAVKNPGETFEFIEHSLLS